MDDVQKHIIRKLFFRRCIGGKHTAIEHCLAGIPRDRRKDANVAVHELVNEGIIILKPTSYGVQASLNPKKLPEISEALEQ